MSCAGIWDAFMALLIVTDRLNDDKLKICVVRARPTVLFE